MAQRLGQLEVWQLADTVRHRVHSILAASDTSLDPKFCSQLSDAAGSVPRNIAEGFGRYRHKEFAHFVDIARGSMFELQDLLRDGVVRRYWTASDIDDLIALCDRTIGGLTVLSRYLKTHPDPPLKRRP